MTPTTAVQPERPAWGGRLLPPQAVTVAVAGEAVGPGGVSAARLTQVHNAGRVEWFVFCTVGRRITFFF